MKFVNQKHTSPDNKEFKKKKQAILQDLDHTQGVHVEHTKAGSVVFDNGIAVLPNDGQAKDIAAELKSRQRHPHQYAFVPDREGMSRDVTHKMRVTSVPVPWGKYDEFGRRIREE